MPDTKCDSCARCAALDHQVADHVVDRLVAAESRARLAEQAIREMQTERGEEPNASYVVALLARIEGLERNIDRLTSRRQRERAGR